VAAPPTARAPAAATIKAAAVIRRADEFVFVVLMTFPFELSRRVVGRVRLLGATSQRISLTFFGRVVRRWSSWPLPIERFHPRRAADPV
jgi:hypothetical protein